MSKLPKGLPSLALPQKGMPGPKGTHSSLVPSLAIKMADHQQFDDEIQDIAPPTDPNISGMTKTEDTYTWLAGPMSAWQGNDDYREFFERSEGPESRILNSPHGSEYSMHDGDYDDDGGFPTAIGQHRGLHGPSKTTVVDSKTEEDGFDVESSQERI